MKCLANSISNVLIYYNIFRSSESVDSLIKELVPNDTKFLDDKSVRQILKKFSMIPNDFQGLIFMPIPYILCNGNSWISVLPKMVDGKYMMEIEYVGKQPGSFRFDEDKEVYKVMTTIKDGGILLKENGYNGGFFVTPFKELNKSGTN